MGWSPLGLGSCLYNAFTRVAQDSQSMRSLVVAANFASSINPKEWRMLRTESAKSPGAKPERTLDCLAKKHDFAVVTNRKE